MTRKEPTTVSRQEVHEHLTVLRSSKAGEAKKLAAAFKAVLSSSGALVQSIIGAAGSGDWSKVGKEMLELQKDPNFGTLVNDSLGMGFETVGVVGGGAVHVVVSVSGMVGVLQPTNAIGVYQYESVGLSVGASEGADAVTGLLVSTAETSQAGGTSLFVSLGVDLGAGVAVEIFTNPGSWFSRNATWGMVILISGGEEIDVSVGAGYGWAERIL
jgi:hypothetical protein